MPVYFNSKLYHTAPRRSSRNWRWLHITRWAQLSNWSTCSIFFVLPHLSLETTTLSVISAVSKTTACIGLQISYPKHNNNDDYDNNNNNNNKDIWDQIQSLFREKEKCVEEQEWKKSFSKTILASWSTMTLTISIYLCCCQSHILPKSPDSGKTCFEMTVCIRHELYKHRVSFPKSPNLSLGALAWEGKVTNCKACFT